MIDITIKATGATEAWLQKLKGYSPYSSLLKIGQLGVMWLAEATPKDSGITADSWTYEIKKKGNNEYSVVFNNNRTADNSSVPVVMLIQYGHALPQGGYVPPYDFINPVMNKLVEMFESGMKDGVS